jgi:hypothetical protein
MKTDFYSSFYTARSFTSPIKRNVLLCLFSRLYSSVCRNAVVSDILFFSSQEPMKSKAPQLHLEYRFYKLLGSHGELKLCGVHIIDLYFFLSELRESFILALSLGKQHVRIAVAG